MHSSQLTRAEEELMYALQRTEKHQPAERLDFGSWAAGYVAGFARAMMILAPDV